MYHVIHLLCITLLHLSPIISITIFTSNDSTSEHINATSTVCNQLVNIFDTKLDTYRIINIIINNAASVSNHPNSIDTITEYSHQLDCFKQHDHCYYIITKPTFYENKINIFPNNVSKMYLDSVKHHIYNNGNKTSDALATVNVHLLEHILSGVTHNELAMMIHYKTKRPYMMRLYMFMLINLMYIFNGTYTQKC